MNTPPRTVCGYPFNFMEVRPNLDVIPCCPEWNFGYCYGNLIANSVDEIWHGNKARELRRSVLENEYSFCNRNACIPMEIIPDASDRYSEQPPSPTLVKFDHDAECNYKCITCRNDVCRTSDEKLAVLNGLIDTMFIPLMEGVSIGNFSGNGDPFVSRHYRKLIRALASTYQNLKFSFHTNGSLCNKKMLEKLGVVARIDGIQISIPAAIEYTYQELTGGGNFALLLSNLSELSAMQKEKMFGQVVFGFVVQNRNFREIPEFILFAERYGARALFWEINDWGAAYAGLNVCDSTHPEHDELKKVLGQVDFSKSCQFSPLLRKIAGLLS